jgi:peptidoglycan/LPS O-acetylase OafA/YrhL
VDLVVLDALRGLAALYVVVGHTHWLLWSGYQEYAASGAGVLKRALALASEGLNYGHQAVLLFFLISGFCIHFRQAGSVAKPSCATRKEWPLSIRSYARQRFRRIYPPLLLALALTAILDYAGSRLNPMFYGMETPYPNINSNLAPDSHAPSTLLGNLILQAGFMVPAFGSNGPLWSLAYECWFYVLYPVLLFMSLRFGSWRTKWSITSLAMTAQLALLLPAIHFAIGSVWPLDIIAYWLIWSFGAWVAERYVIEKPLPLSSSLTTLAILALMALAVAPKVMSLTPFPSSDFGAGMDLLWSAPLGVLFSRVLLCEPGRVKSIIERFAHALAPLGAISYSLYVVHFPILALLSAWWLSSHPRLPLGPELAVLGTSLSLIFASGAWYLVERHFVSSSKQRIEQRRQHTSLLPA